MFEIIAASCIAIGVQALMTKKYGFFTWQAGIPLFYVLYFILFPILEQVLGYYDYSVEADLASISFISAFALVFFAIGCLLFDLFAKHTRRFHPLSEKVILTQFEQRRPLLFIAAIGTVASIIGFVGGYANFEGKGGNIGGIVSSFTICLAVACAVSFQYFIRNNFKFDLYGKVALCTTLVYIISGVTSTSKSVILFPLILFLIIYYLEKKKIPYKLFLTIGASYVLVILPVVTFLRFTRLPEASFTSVIDSIYYVISNIGIGNESASAYSNSDLSVSAGLGSIGRAHLLYFISVSQMSGSSIEFMGGETYARAIQSLLPRIIFSDKEELGMWNNAIARMFGMIHSSNLNTNMSPTQFSELYMNFGILGLFGGMFVWGLISGFLFKYIVGTSSWLAGLAFLNVNWQEMFVEASIIPFAKSLLVFVFVSLLSILFISKRKRY